MERSAHWSRRRLERGAVSLGFSALTVAVLVAYANPATEYELSLYTGTPLGFWIGFGLAILVSVFVALLTRDGTVRLLALTLGGYSITAFTGLPLLRSYYFYASGDSLTHLGWIHEMALGNLRPVDLIYPGVHVFTVFTSRLAGYRLERATMLVVVAFVVVYLLFIALSMRALTASGLGRAIGALSGFLLLPINVIVTKLAVHPISQAVFYFALVFYLFTKFVKTGDAEGRFTNVGVLLAVVAAAVVLYHPQQAAVVLVLFGTVSMVQYVGRRWSDSGRPGEYRSMYAQTLFLAAVFVLWAIFHSNLRGQMSSIASTVIEFIKGSGVEAGAVVTQRRASLATVGSGIDEIFLKLFLVSAIFSLLAGGAMLASVFTRLETVDDDARTIQRYVSFGFMVLAPFAFLHFVGNMSKLYFRYHASMMLIVTVLGAFGLYYLVGHRFPWTVRARSVVETLTSFNRKGGSTPSARDAPGGSVPSVSDAHRVVIGIALVSMLVLSLATVFPSPFIYQPSVHATEAQMEGYETAFAHQDPAAKMSGVSMPVWRYRHAILGVMGRSFGPTFTPRGTFDHNLTGYMSNVSRGDGGHYLVVTTYDRRAEADVYGSLHFTEADFRELRAAPHVNLVQSNGEFQLYYTVDERSPNATASPTGARLSDSAVGTRRHVEPSRGHERARSVRP